jgi:hypothetical protein
MSGSIYIPSNATIIPSASTKKMVFVSYTNPEAVLPPLLSEWLAYLDFASIYPNFGTPKVGAVHPFAVFLLATVLGNKIDFGILPSITVADSSAGEDSPTLGKEYFAGTLGASDVAAMKGAWQTKRVMASSQNIARLEAATAGGVLVAYTRRTFVSRHSIDFNFWSDNKDVTSMLYEAVLVFLYDNIERLGELGLNMMGGVTGRRSGDINMEFGRLLYGANITAPVNIARSVLSVDIPMDIIDNIELNPTYHEPDVE